MTETAIRLIKGQLMCAMFGLFFLGILFVLFFVFPVTWLLNRFFEERPRMQGALRVSFSFWLGLLRGLGLLKALPPRGKPYDGPSVVVCNHPGLFDVLFMIRDIPNLSVLVKYTLSRKLPLGPILKASGYVLASDYDRISPLDTAEASLRAIERGGRLQLFPEGTRSPAGGLRPFKPGAFKLARMTETPVQPVLIRNDPPFFPKEDKWYLPPRKTSRLQLEFWPPIRPPAKGEERAYTRDLESRYRKALGLES
ncbi:MAG: 1-acyl-sn-glycerol-3-phosphate acyltransferase [Deltaproteobacteria bacterium]|nr:1-acyl-sn-glycerol-3-phosphate acyltransferase [Deltaproteobacteria bacterium]